MIWKPKSKFWKISLHSLTDFYKIAKLQFCIFPFLSSDLPFFLVSNWPNDLLSILNYKKLFLGLDMNKISSFIKDFLRQAFYAWFCYQYDSDSAVGVFHPLYEKFIWKYIVLSGLKIGLYTIELKCLEGPQKFYHLCIINNPTLLPI